MRFGRLALLILFARLAAAQTPGATIRGVVHDSIDHRSLGGAAVQLVSTDAAGRPARTVMTDSLGRFALDSVPPGRYALGFFHAKLDSLGLEPPVRQVTVTGGGTVRADLAIPSAARVHAAICGEASARDSSAVVIGVVRDAVTGTAVADATVTVAWLEFSITREGLVHRTPRIDVTTGQSGWFAICSVPRGGSLTLSASRAADSTAQIDVEVPSDRLVRQDLYIGEARTVVTESPPVDDTLAPPSRRVYVGSGRLTGTVVGAAGGRPLAGASVSIVGGPETRTNERGAWTLVNAPLGTRMLEVRAVSHSPVRLAVHVVTDAPPVRVSMMTIQAMLDTVRVRASAADRDRSGFEARRRSGMGRYISAEDVLRRRPIVASDLLFSVPGVRMVESRQGFDKQILVRGGPASTGWCAPSLYVNGNYLFEATADELNSWAAPDEIVGVEIYTGISAPVQFQRSRDGCGAIVVWTRPAVSDRKLSAGRLVTGLGLTALAIAIGLLAR